MLRVVLASMLSAVLLNPARAEDVKEPRGLGDPGTFDALKLGPELSDGIVIRGRDARQQLFASAVYSSGQVSISLIEPFSQRPRKASSPSARAVWCRRFKTVQRPSSPRWKTELERNLP